LRGTGEDASLGLRTCALREYEQRPDRHRDTEPHAADGTGGVSRVEPPDRTILRKAVVSRVSTSSTSNSSKDVRATRKTQCARQSPTTRTSTDCRRACI